MRKCLIVFLTLSFINSKGQSLQVGVGLVDLSTAYVNIKNPDTTSTGKTRSNLNFKPVLTFNFVKKNNIDLSLQAGYFHERFYNATKSVAFDKSVGYQTSKTIRNSVYLKLGIARRIDYKKIYISYGIQVPLSVNFYYNTNTNSSINDSLGNLIQSSSSTNNLPSYYYTGLLLNFGSFYKLCKNLYVGGELQYGLYYSLQYGKRTYTTNSVYPTSPSISTTQTFNYNNSQFQLVVIPTIHIRYTIFNKKSGEDVKPLQQ